jgi:hypothetical protein
MRGIIKVDSIKQKPKHDAKTICKKTTWITVLLEKLMVSHLINTSPT